jgi:hypothetical protein
LTDVEYYTVMRELKSVDKADGIDEWEIIE